MPQNATIYRWAATALALVWLLSFGLSLDDVLGRTPYPPLLVEPWASPGGRPVVVDLKTGLGAEASGLRPGDLLVRLGGVDLAGAGPARWRALFARRATNEPIEVEYERDGVRAETTLVAASSMRQYWPRLVASVAFVLCSLLLSIRVKPSPLQRAIILMNLSVAVMLCCFFMGGVTENRIGFAVHLVSASLVMPLSLRAYLMFPHGQAPRSALTRYGPWAFASLGLFDLSRFEGTPLPIDVASVGAAALSVAFTVLLMVVIVRAYRRSTPPARRQIKWVLLGLGLTAVSLTIAGILTAAYPGASWLLAVAVSATGILPVCMLISVARYNFLDVDGLLSGAAAGALVLGLGVAFAIFALPPISDALTGPLGLHRATASFVLVAALAIVALPAQRALRQGLERVIFADQQALESGVARLNVELSSCRTPKELAQHASAGLADLFGVDECSIHHQSGDLFLPLDVRGQLSLPRFGIGSPLLAVLESQSGPLCLDLGVGAARLESLDPFQRAVLETLQVPLVVPIRRDHELLAFVCMGAKRSGDLYTRTDLTLLSFVADKIASELRSYDQADALEAEQALQSRLKRFVPGPLAERITRGEEIAAAREELSIVFVDLRGFTGYTEDVSPEQVFEIVNDYTTLVSTLIDQHGGTVVEFNGDGMMAIFGAPRRLPRKERAAVRASCAIVDRVPTLGLGGRPLRVGVGVATGEAFVGSVQAVDRMIWTALGNPTNLASRLQSLTRDYEVPMLIDEATWEGAGSPAPFRRIGELAIRGFSTKFVAYALEPGFDPGAFDQAPG